VRVEKERRKKTEVATAGLSVTPRLLGCGRTKASERSRETMAASFAKVNLLSSRIRALFSAGRILTNLLPASPAMMRHGTPEDLVLAGIRLKRVSRERESVGGERVSE
jgi:hypothetical protein